MVSFKLLLFSSLSFLFMLGCNDKNDTPPPADIAGVITYTQPGAGATFMNGTTLQVSGNVIDNNGLAAVKVEIRNASSNAILYQQNVAITGNPTYFDFGFNWPVSGITTNTNAVVKVIATDRYSYVVSKEVNVILIN